ncbi:uncharacterized protein LOC126653755 [Mercurialis annua]|uniref:uncharacterized protein LOC126653755 n=1 Tax=Mercurialis annua TaxID=3986 RepID=UPI0024AD5E11|nr:uncharacterized protein LOC126653755 [Mercurialis annua]
MNYLDDIKIVVEELPGVTPSVSALASSTPTASGGSQTMPASRSALNKPPMKKGDSSSRKVPEPSTRLKQASAKRRKLDLDLCPDPRAWIEEHFGSASIHDAEVSGLYSQFLQLSGDMDAWRQVPVDDIFDKFDASLLHVVQGVSFLRQQNDHLTEKYERELASLRQSAQAETQKLKNSLQVAVDKGKILERKVADRDASLLEVQRVRDRLLSEQKENRKDVNAYISGCLTDFCATAVGVVRQDYPDYDIGKFLAIDLRALGQRVMAKTAAKKKLPVDASTEKRVASAPLTPRSTSGATSTSDEGLVFDKPPLSETAALKSADDVEKEVAEELPTADSSILVERPSEVIPEDALGVDDVPDKMLSTGEGDASVTETAPSAEEVV